jgi:hypothetical protein
VTRGFRLPTDKKKSKVIPVTGSEGL